MSDEEMRQTKEVIQSLFAGEVDFFRGAEQQVRTFVASFSPGPGSEFAYHSIMNFIAMSRIYGQFDGVMQMLHEPNPSDVDEFSQSAQNINVTDFNTAISHLLAEFTAKVEEYQQLIQQHSSSDRPPDKRSWWRG